jgi:hypothetical protein
MNSRKRFALAARSSLLLSLLLSLDARADWAQSTDPLVVRAAPADGQVQAQNPPGFTWARYPGASTGYEIEITPAGGVPTRASVTRNWYLPTRALALGNYTWRVRPAGSSDWSAPRAFSITTRSTLFEVPDNDTLRARIAARAHPRSLPPSFTPYSTWNTARKNDLDANVSQMSNEVKLQMGAMPDLADSNWPLVLTSPMTAAMAAQYLEINRRVGEASRQLEAASVMWRLMRDPMFLAEAKKRGDQMAALDPAGPTGFVQQDQASPLLAMALMKSIDVLAGDLDPARKARWLDIVRIRTNQLYGDLASNGGRLDQYPFDPHANENLVILTLVASLAVGDIPDATQWFDFAFRAYANSLSPWSGPEGGYANGTAYGEYAAAAMVAIADPLLQATGVNFYAKPWTIGFLDFMMQFLPPGSNAHAFGDGSDTRPDPRVFQAFASRLVSPRAAWYVDSLRSYESALSRLQAPYPLPVSGTTLKAPPSNSAYYPAIGWTAMHSDLGSSARVSYFFKSSPYGSFNHSHGDQNGLLVSVAGQPLLVKAGWYDWYGSPYWSDWYRQTRSQNAVTYDGGIGQDVGGYRETLQHNGKITSFAAQPGYDAAEGDATAAYGGALTMARRQVWHLRNAGNALLVRDRLAASVPHTYEWNVHAPAVMLVETPASVKIAAGGQLLCLRALTPGVSFAKWSGPAPKSGVVEDHGAFYLKNDGRSVAEFLTLVDAGCRRPNVTISTTGTVRTVTVGAQSVTLN